MQLSFMAVLVLVVLVLAMAGGSSGAQWCICKDQVSDSVLQKSLDYTCGVGADCTPIQPNGACFQPNTVKSHCSYAANSYFQKKGQTQGSCDFSGTAIVTSTDPSPRGSCSLSIKFRWRCRNSTIHRQWWYHTAQRKWWYYTLPATDFERPAAATFLHKGPAAADFERRPATAAFCLSATTVVSVACLQQQPFCCPSAAISAFLQQQPFCCLSATAAV